MLLVFEGETPRERTFAVRRWGHFDECDNEVAHIRACGPKVRIDLPFLCHRPLSYHAAPGRLFIAHSPLEIARALKMRGSKPSLDETALWEWLLLSMPLCGRTLFSGVRQTQLGQSLSVHVPSGTVEEERAFSPKLYGPPSEKDLLPKAKEVLAETLRKVCEKTEFLVPLSGGLDSRVLLGGAKMFGGVAHAFTFGSFGSAEVKYARGVAHAEEIPWIEVSLRPNDYLAFGRELSIETGGMLSAMHMHLFSCVRRMKFAGPMLHGFMGDPIAGDHATLSPVPMTREEAYEHVVRSRLLDGGPFAPFVPRHVQGNIERDLSGLLDACLRANDPTDFEEYLFLTERQSMIAYLPAALELDTPTLCPFASWDYAEFFLSLPRAARAQRSLFRDAFASLFPSLARLPSTASLPKGSLETRLRGIERRGRALIQHGTDFFTRGKHVLFSPHAYEQHDYLVHRVIHEPLFDSAHALERRTGSPFVAVANLASSRRIRRPDVVFGIFSAAAVLSALDGPGGGLA